MNIHFVQIVDPKDYSPNFRPLAFPYLKSSVDASIPGCFFSYSTNLDHIPDSDVYLVSSLSQDWDAALSIIKEIRLSFPNVIIIVGGQHITQLPQLLPQEADFACVGEGELSLPMLLKFLMNNLVDFTPTNIPGLAFHDKLRSNVAVNPARRLTAVQIRLPDRSLRTGFPF